MKDEKVHGKLHMPNVANNDKAHGKLKFPNHANADKVIEGKSLSAQMNEPFKGGKMKVKSIADLRNVYKKKYGKGSSMGGAGYY
jgi:hypothetical protein